MTKISLRPSIRDELEHFDSMDRQIHANRFVNQTGLQTHRAWFEDPAIHYLSIVDDQSGFYGYFILVRESDGESIEFRRILIDQNCRGVGQAAIVEMEDYCRRELAASRIWLDVYEDNAIGRHVYEKLGYRRFDAQDYEGRRLLFYEKLFSPPGSPQADPGKV